MSTVAAYIAVGFVSVAVSEMLAALWRGLRRVLARRQDGPKCPCGCGNPPSQHNRPRFPRQRTPQEN
ncbi:hypothetical protein OHV05_24675 [Kitasatospora sp. NBC_00070]|uniref:hypothetical protein n=1 Tax=Kitasatospora sp. NBC_00070 TaxID=2975962 RepID=UPI00324E639F